MYFKLKKFTSIGLKTRHPQGLERLRERFIETSKKILQTDTNSTRVDIFENRSIRLLVWLELKLNNMKNNYIILL